MDIPIQIIMERRSSTRASINKNNARLRVPIQFSPEQINQQIEWFEKWLADRIRKTPDLLNRFKEKQYKDGDELVVGKKKYQLRINHSNKKSHSGRLKQGTLHLELSNQIQLQKPLKSLLSKLIAQDHLPEIEARVHFLNKKFFNQTIKSVKIKYNHSRWGSCSTDGNITFSSRLLFAPESVIDYVIIHELAHLIEFNHSQKFWRIIQKTMPSYMEKERWLKENGNNCDF